MRPASLKGIHAEAFTAGQREVGKGFVGVIGLAVMMSQFLGYFGEAVRAAPLDFARRS